jgi:hypothetical protein
LEGGYQFETHDTYDLITDVIGLEADEQVVQDVISALPDQEWCGKDSGPWISVPPFAPGGMVSWTSVKHHTRYNVH